jgi:AP2-associated kinase
VVAIPELTTDSLLSVPKKRLINPPVAQCREGTQVTVSTSAMAYPPPAHGVAHRGPPPASNAPPGTFLPGTKVQVGSQRVIIEKYLSEGGFAHVYVARVPRDNNQHEIAVLKRVAVPDKDHLASMRTEVETMKKLKGHRHIVTYMDSHASQLNGGGYEVFLLMEFCSGGGLIDFMNTRLQHRLTEPEILKIFGDVAEGVACMHYLKPPLLHRDLKVENVLISKSGSGSTTYKLCDFGSTAAPRAAARTPEEGRLIEEDVQKHTTMQYRSPEMIDVWRKQPIDEKADIWALGVLLYKLCYYTTPFEEVGQMAILNASFKYPSYPQFSDKLKKFIGWMLKEDPRYRPNIYQVIKETCGMRGTPIPIKDIYADRTQSEARRNQTLPPNESAASSTGPIGLQKASSRIDAPRIPDIAPMRRGRPTAMSQKIPTSAQPSPSPARGDPFAALDSKNHEVRAGAVDELSKRFPRLDEFSIAHEPSGQFQFDHPVTSPELSKVDDRATRALADDPFASIKPRTEMPKPQSASQLNKKPVAPPAKPKVAENMREPSQQSPLMHQPTPVRPNPAYKSTATGSSPPHPAKLQKPKAAGKPEFKMPEISKRPIWKVPEHSRSTSVPRVFETAGSAPEPIQPQLQPAKRPTILDSFRSKSHTSTVSPRSPTSSRPSLEGHRPSHLEIDDPSNTRAHSAQQRQRPSSVYVSSNLEFLRDQEAARRPSVEIRRSVEKNRSRQSSPRLMAFDNNEQILDDANIENDLDYLRSNEEADNGRRRSGKQGSSGHKKRTSLSSIANAKNIFAGKLGDAFKRFEQDPDGGKKVEDQRPRTPEAQYRDDTSQSLSPIQGSEPTPSRYIDTSFDETEDLPPETKRELERQQLVQEEKRVADAAAQYRANATANGTGNSSNPSRASTIQKRVQSLLDEGRRSPVAPRTAEGYGKFTDQTESVNQPLPPRPSSRNKPAVPLPSRQPPIDLPTAGLVDPRVRTQPSGYGLTHTVSAPPAVQHPRIVSRPSAPPKPKVLRAGQWAQAQEQTTESARPLQVKPTGLAALLAKDLEGVPDYPAQSPNPAAPIGHRDNFAPQGGRSFETGDAAQDLEADFSARYPSLTGIEMVEREIGSRDVREV